MFDHLENEIALYERHLTDNEIEGPQIEQAFIGYVLTRIYAEFEKSIKSAINDRCYIESDIPLNEVYKIGYNEYHQIKNYRPEWCSQ